MASVPTADDGYDISFLPSPETTHDRLPLVRHGSVASSVRIWGFVNGSAAKEVLLLSVSPTTIASGTLKVDLLVNGSSILKTMATATVADTPVPATFTTTRIPAAATVLVATTSDSSTVTDVFGTLVIRPLLGAERHV